MANQLAGEELKRKLRHFTKLMLQFGTLKGFQHFTLYIRGKEELVISIHNQPTTTSPEIIKTGDLTAGESFNSAQIPYDKQSLMMSQRTQKQLSGLGRASAGLPPPSPSDQEQETDDLSVTLFLLGVYNNYSSPYVWVRTNHHRLVSLLGEHDRDKDNPLKLKSSAQWITHPVQPWDFVAEVVKLCMFPPPTNPFQLDWTYLNDLPLGEKLLTYVALVHFFNNLLVSQQTEKYYTGKVLEELEHLQNCHLATVQSSITDPSSPLLERRHRSTSSQSSEPNTSSQRRRLSSTTYQYPAQHYPGISQSTQGTMYQSSGVSTMSYMQSAGYSTSQQWI